MEGLLAELGKNMDMVIIDSPPSIVADVQVLAAKVDAVLLVIQPGRTQRNATKSTMQVLKRANARILGFVINRMMRAREDYYSQYHYQSYHLDSTSDKKMGINRSPTEQIIQSERKSPLDKLKKN
jgi:Mrp family chromosome partitioning ATPase